MKSNLVSSLYVFGLAVMAGCNGVTEPAVPAPEIPKFTCLSNSHTMSLPAELRAALPPSSGGRGLQDAYLAISQSVPGGFAGMVWETNHFVLTFVEPEKANAARAEIERALVTNRAVAPGTDLRTVEIRGGVRWTFVELDEWFRYFVEQRLFVPGVSGWGIDEGHNTIHVAVIDETSRAQLEAKLASAGVSCNLVTTVIQLYAQAL